MSAREQALAEYEARIRATGTKAAYAFLGGFTRGWDARDAEVERLTAQLQAAQAEAWDKGYSAAQEDDDVNAWITTDNPYRASIEQTEAK